jgi:hypothetical protein
VGDIKGGYELVNGAGYDWAEAFGNDYENLGRKHYFGRRTVFLGWGMIAMVSRCMS